MIVRYVLTLCALSSMAVVVSTSRAAERPNIVLVMVDDMGFSDLGCYGGEIETPNLDKLAANGLRFTQFYNGAKCETTRRMLLSGLYHPEVDLSKNHNITIAEGLRQAGYTTLMSGKWHIRSTPPQRGFERYFGHLSGATPFFKGNETFRLDSEKFDVPEQGFYTTHAMTDFALKFLDDSTQQDKPFFLYIAYNAPHYPLQAPQADVEKYRGKYMMGWEKLRKQRHARQLKMGLFKKPWKFSPAHPEAKQWDALSDEQKKKEDLTMATYAAMIDIVDRSLGRVVDKLKTKGQFDNTLFLFLSDNGACPFDRTRNGHLEPWDPESYLCYHPAWANACNTPLRWFKQNQHEGGISTPLIVHWPAGLQAKPGSITHQPGHLVDIMTTCLDVAGGEYPQEHNGTPVKPLRGKSLTPIIAGKQRDPHEAIFFQFSDNRAVRAGDWKLVSARGQPWELYNMASDRTELNDLSESEPERAKKLAGAWDDWARSVALSNSSGKKKRDKKGRGK